MLNFPGAPVLPASGPLVTSGATTTLALPPLVAGGADSIFDANRVTVSITNPTASGQTISSGSLIFTDTVGGVTSTITYALTSASIAAGANQVFDIALTSGILRTATLSVTFGSNPAAGTLACLTIWRA